MIDTFEAQPLTDDQLIAAQELCRACRLDMATLIELAELGVVAPRGASPDAWQLPAAALARLRVASRLMHDLGVNVSGAALALELLDVQHELERRVRLLERLTVGFSDS
jgi:chaperone modulatory protein CbpM